MGGELSVFAVGWVVSCLCCGVGGELSVFAVGWVVSCLSLLWGGW